MINHARLAVMNKKSGMDNREETWLSMPYEPETIAGFPCPAPTQKFLDA